MKPWDDIVAKDMGRLRQKGTKGESEMLKAYAKKYLFDIVRMLGVVPSDLLLLLKTNDCLRHIDLSLGVPINTASILASTTAQVLLKEDIKSGDSCIAVLQAYVSYWKLKSRVLGLQTLERFPFLAFYLGSWT